MPRSRIENTENLVHTEALKQYRRGSVGASRQNPENPELIKSPLNSNRTGRFLSMPLVPAICVPPKVRRGAGVEVQLAGVGWGKSAVVLLAKRFRSCTRHGVAEFRGNERWS